MKLIINANYGLYEKNGKPYCDSLQIAKAFEKRHDHVLRDIENHLVTFSKINDPKFGEINFIKTSYKDGKNRPQSKYLLSKDGFVYLAMGYEGEKAAMFKIEYIKRFNQMEEYIKTLQSSKIEFRAFTDAIAFAKDELKPYHISNEINMIYRIVLGVDAKKFRGQNGLPEKVSIKPHLTLEQIKIIETLQRIDIGLLETGHSFEERKAILANSFNKRLSLAA